MFVAAAVATAGILGLAHFKVGRAGVVPLLLTVSALVLAGAWAYGLRIGLILVLTLTVVLDRYFLSTGSIAVRPEQIAALIGIVAVISISVARRAEAAKAARLLPAEAALVLWLALNVVSTIYASPSPRDSLRVLALVTLSSLGLWLPRRLLTTRPQLEMATKGFLWIWLAAAAFGVFCYALYTFGVAVGASVNPATGRFAAFGSLWEPNVLGAVCIESAVAWLLLGPLYYPDRLVGLLAGLAIAGSVASYTRAAWVALAVVVIAMLMMPALRSRLSWRIVVGAGASTIAFSALVLAMPSLHQRLAPEATVQSGGAAATAPGPADAGSVKGEPGAGSYIPPTPSPAPHSSRAASLLNSVDVIGRLDQIQQVRADLGANAARWLLGGGTASFGQRHQYLGTPLWIASLPLRLLNDTGIVGTATFLAFAGLITREAWQRRRQFRVAAFASVAVVLALTALSTETLELMVGWLVLGLMLAVTEQPLEVV